MQKNPVKFASELNPFIEVNTAYKHDLFHGFREAWNAKKSFSLDSVLAFMRHIFESDEFWEKEYGEHEINYRNWLVSEVAEFIEAGTREQEKSFVLS